MRALLGERIALDFHDYEEGYEGYTSSMIIVDRALGLAWDFYLRNRKVDILLDTLNEFLNYLQTAFGIGVKEIEVDNEILKHERVGEELRTRGIKIELSSLYMQA